MLKETIEHDSWEGSSNNTVGFLEFANKKSDMSKNESKKTR